MNDSPYTVQALGKLRKDVLMLDMAGSYLSEDIFLVKFGKDIAQNVQKLKDDIGSLKKQYPGKFKSEIETDGILDQIDQIARTMSKPDRSTKEKCASGELGRALESQIRSITEAVRLINKQVYGKEVTYTRKDSVVDRVSHTGRSIGHVLVLGLKIILGLIIIAVLAFLYLFFTMEKEGDYLEEIEKSRAGIVEQQEMIAQLDQKKEEISKQIKATETGDMQRGGKITVLDLEVQLHNVNEDRMKAETEIAGYEKKITENQQKVEKIKKKPFLKRLLRQDS